MITVAEKACSKCKTVKLANCFRRRDESRSKTGLRSWCKDCENTYQFAFRRTEKFRAYQREYKRKCWTDEAFRKKKYKIARESRQRHKLKYKLEGIKKKFGIGKQEYYEMLDRQKNKCAVCGEVFKNDCGPHGPQVDHCHRTDLVRGLLCRMCNIGAGMFSDDPDLMRAAAKYIEDFERNLDFENISTAGKQRVVA